MDGSDGDGPVRGGGEGLSGPPVERVVAAAYRVPTDAPESDGTLAWDATTMVTVEVEAGEETGLGYSYTSSAAAALVADTLADEVLGTDPLAVTATWERLVRRIRNLGRPGLCSMAIAAVDTALWDLAARRLGVPLFRLLGGDGRAVPVYGSGGFTSYDEGRLRAQLGGWVADGIRRVKMKVGREPDADPGRVRAARDAIGPGAGLMVDANGGYDPKRALAQAAIFAELGVDWFEEPVSSDDLAGLRLLRDRVPAPIEVAAGEYGFDLFSFRRMLDAGAVDVLQADVTRCGGITELVRVAALCRARNVPLSAHTAPALHLHPCSALPVVRHIEWFHDHVRVERMLLEGAPAPEDGTLRPDPSRPGHGLRLRRDAAAGYETRREERAA